MRAAAHCHRCGETFALEFPSLDDTGSLPGAPGAAEAPAPAGSTLDAASSQPTRRRVVATRAAALLLGMTAIALLSAYYAYRQPGIGPNGAANGDGSQPAGSAVATEARQEPTTEPMSQRTAPDPSTESPVVARVPADAAGGAPAAAVGAATATHPAQPARGRSLRRRPKQRQPVQDRAPSEAPGRALRSRRPGRASPARPAPIRSRPRGRRSAVRSKSGRCPIRTRSPCSKSIPPRRCGRWWRIPGQRSGRIRRQRSGPGSARAVRRPSRRCKRRPGVRA